MFNNREEQCSEEQSEAKSNREGIAERHKGKQSKARQKVHVGS
jgi:hypothetical protein